MECQIESPDRSSDRPSRSTDDADSLKCGQAYVAQQKLNVGADQDAGADYSKYKVGGAAGDQKRQ
jgi:hypothetical protein